mmetsp:Transcript_50380/g.116299  ORF Transcript_50380/g.116299 Transcript_50380/m.116299 type:complete len:210 (+) Transcript_50380:227-856(+)
MDLCRRRRRRSYGLVCLSQTWCTYASQLISSRSMASLWSSTQRSSTPQRERLSSSTSSPLQSCTCASLGFKQFSRGPILASLLWRRMESTSRFAVASRPCGSAPAQVARLARAGMLQGLTRWLSPHCSVGRWRTCRHSSRNCAGLSGSTPTHSCRQICSRCGNCPWMGNHSQRCPIARWRSSRMLTSRSSRPLLPRTRCREAVRSTWAC